MANSHNIPYCLIYVIQLFLEFYDVSLWATYEVVFLGLVGAFYLGGGFFLEGRWSN